MVINLHTLIKEESKNRGWPPVLCWIDEKPTWVTSGMLVQSDPQLEKYFGTYQLDLLKQNLRAAGTEHVSGSVRGYYDLESIAGHLQVTGRHPVDYYHVATLDSHLTAGRNGEELILDLSRTFYYMGEHHNHLHPKSKSDRVPERIFVPEHKVEYLQQIYPHFSAMKVRYAEGVYFHDENTIAALSLVNIPDAH